MNENKDYDMKINSQKRRRGRPKVDTSYTNDPDRSRRVEMNLQYVLEGSGLFLDAGDEIPDSKLLYDVDCPLSETVIRNGIMEQLGRLYVQDKAAYDDCVYIANLAVNAFKGGATSRSIEKAIRKIRMAGKQLCCHSTHEQKQEYLYSLLELYRMGK